MSEVVSRYAEGETLSAEQQTEMLSEAARTVRVDMLADGAPQDVKGMFAQYAKALEPVLARLRGNQKTRKDAAVDAEARKALEGNPGITEIIDIFDANLGMDTKIATVEMIINAADENVAELSRRAVESGSPEEQLQARMLAERVVAMQKVSKGIGTEQGRAFRMRRFNRKDPRFSEQLMAGLAAYGGQDANEAFLTAMSNAADRAERMKVAEVGVGRRTQDAIVEGVTAGMLFGPSTHIVNAMSNSIQLVNEIMTRGYAQILGTKVPGGVAPGEVQAMLLGIWQGFGNIRRMWSDHRQKFQGGMMGTMKALADGEGMWGSAGDASILMDTGHMDRAISRQTAEEVIGRSKRWLGMSQEHGRVTGGLSTAVEYLGRFLSLPYTALLHSDQVFKTLAYHMEMNAQVQRAAKGDPKEIAKMNAQPPEDLKEKAAAFARRVTFQDDLGKIGANINAIRNEMPLTRLLLPFLKTPVNIYKEGARMTPFLNKVFKDIRAEQNHADPAVRQLAEAKLMVGSMVWGSAMVAAGMGLLTGPGPEDPAEKQRKLATGWRPNALIINGDHYQIDRLDPLAAVFNSAAFLVELRDHLQVDDLETAMMMGIGQSLRLLTNRTYIESFSDAMQLLTNFERAAPIMQRRMGGMLVPASALGRTAVRATDPFQHEVDGFWAAIKSNIPGLSASLPVRRDFLGQPMEGLEYAGTNWLSPFQVGRHRDDEVYQEVARLQQAGFSAAPIPNRRLTVQGQNYKMNGEEYSRFLDLYGNEVKINGLSAKQALDKLVASPRYGLMYDEERAEAIKATLTVYGKQARKRMVDGDEKIRNALNVRNKGMNFFFGLN